MPIMVAGKEPRIVVFGGSGNYMQVLGVVHGDLGEACRGLGLGPSIPSCPPDPEVRVKDPET